MADTADHGGDLGWAYKPELDQRKNIAPNKYGEYNVENVDQLCGNGHPDWLECKAIVGNRSLLIIEFKAPTGVRAMEMINYTIELFLSLAKDSTRTAPLSVITVFPSGFPMAFPRGKEINPHLLAEIRNLIERTPPLLTRPRIVSAGSGFVLTFAAHIQGVLAPNTFIVENQVSPDFLEPVIKRILQEA